MPSSMLRRIAVVIAHERQPVRQARLRRGKPRVERECLSEHLDGLEIARAILCAQLLRLRVQPVGFHVLRRPLLQPRLLVGRQARVQGPRNLLGDVALHCRARRQGCGRIDWTRAFAGSRRRRAPRSRARDCPPPGCCRRRSSGRRARARRARRRLYTRPARCGSGAAATATCESCPRISSVMPAAK